MWDEGCELAEVVGKRELERVVKGDPEALKEVSNGVPMSIQSRDRPKKRRSYGWIKGVSWQGWWECWNWRGWSGGTW